MKYLLNNLKSSLKKTGAILGLCLFMAPQLKAQIENMEAFSIYGDLIMTPVMAYTITNKGSNIPTHFLLANGVKANIGFEVGVLYKVYTTDKHARAFLSAGISRHFLGFDYGGDIINLGEQRISNHRHNRFFFGLKFIPFNQAKYFTISATAGYGNIVANYASKNINGKIKARTGDIAISFSFGLNKFVFNPKK